MHPETKPEFTPRILISHCLRAASIVTGVRRDLIASDARQSSVVLARQFGMAVAFTLTGQGMPAIGRGFGGRDHATVIGAIRRADELAAADPLAARTMRAIADKARQLAGDWPQSSGLPVPEEVRKPTLRHVPSLGREGLTDHQRREMRHLRAKGWSVNGLARRFEIDTEQVYAELGEKSPRQIAA